jgi:hypothetical protein
VSLYLRIARLIGAFLGDLCTHSYEGPISRGTRPRDKEELVQTRGSFEPAEAGVNH